MKTLFAGSRTKKLDHISALTNADLCYLCLADQLLAAPGTTLGDEQRFEQAALQDEFVKRLTRIGFLPASSAVDSSTERKDG